MALRRALLAGLVAAAALPVPAAAAASACPAGPAPPPLARPASAARIEAYVRAVGRASPVVDAELVGRAGSGRAIHMAVVTRASPAARDRALARMRAVRAGAPRHVTGGPAVVWLAGSVHGNEPSGADADLRVLHDLARRCHDPLLRRLIVVILPDQNPDGRDRRTRVDGAGLDLNRDWLGVTQDETYWRLAALRKYPPQVYADQHEQGGRAFFAPPYAAPVNPALPAAPLRAERRWLGPAIKGALRRRGVDVAGRTFDLQYPGYGDSATTLLFGAAGMTLEAGDQQPFAARVAAHVTAAHALLRSAAAHRASLLKTWPRAFAPYRGVVSGWSLARGSDAAVAALSAQGVNVRRLTAPFAVAGLRPWGGGPVAPAELPAGSSLVRTKDPLWRWASAVLGQDDPAGPAGGDEDVRAWSLGLLGSEGGGSLRGPVPPGGASRPDPDPAPLAGRRIALLADPGAGASIRAGLPQPSASTAWARLALLGAGRPAVDVLGDGAIATGGLAGHDTLVVADGTTASLSPAALDAIRSFVAAGGTLAAWCGRGLAVARATGLSTAVLTRPASGARSAGTALRVLAGDAGAYAIASNEPVLAGGTPAGRYADGSVAVTDDRVGAGRVLLLGFDPAFRAATPTATRLLSGLLRATAGAR